MPEEGVSPKRLALILAAAASLASCGGADEAAEPAIDERPASRIDREATAVHEKIGVTARMALKSDGIAYRVAGGTTGEEIGFGVGRASIERIARQQFGEPVTRSSNAECGAGPMSFSRYGPLQFNFQDGRLVGWRLEAGGDLTTVDGVRPGVTDLNDLEAERAVTMVEGSTLGREFRYAAADGGEIGGFASEDGMVTSLHAGINCFFR